MVSNDAVGVRAWQVKQTRTAASYEKMVLRVNAWMVEQDFDPFVRIVEVSSGRYQLELISDDGVPRVPMLEAVIDAGGRDIYYIFDRVFVKN